VYTFNGWGEYWLVKNENLFNLQGRTALAWDRLGNEVHTATIFVAFAARHVVSNTSGAGEPSRLQIELTADRGG